MKLSDNLPLDIFRLLVEFSASASLESARTLSVVSKEVQQWTDPHLFQFVRDLHDPDFEEGPCIFERMCSPVASPRLVLARKFVRGATWKHFEAPESRIQQVLEYFPNLVQMCLWNNFFPLTVKGTVGKVPFDFTRVYPYLRRIATGLHDSRIPIQAFKAPFWKTVTHLQLRLYGPISSPCSSFKEPGLLAAMPALTHLAVSPMMNQRELDTRLALSYLQQSFPPSLKLCLVKFLAPSDNTEGEIHDWFEELVRASLKVDDRIVLWSAVPYANQGEIVVGDPSSDETFHMWCGVEDGVKTFWEIGDSVLEKRQERLRARREVLTFHL